MKNHVLSAVGLVLLVVAALATHPSAPPAYAGPAAASMGTISVGGEADVRVVPDQVVLSLGVESVDPTLSGAKQANDKAVARLIALAPRHGIARKDVQTDHISVEPRYRSQNYEERVVIGYTVRNNLTFVLRDVGKFDALLTDALGAGANVVHGVQFRTTQLRKYRDQARDLAMKAAREKATALAAAEGMRIGAATSIQETASTWWCSYSYWGGGRGGQMTQNVVQNASSGGADTADELMAPGQIDVTGRVAVTYTLLPAR